VPQRTVIDRKDADGNVFPLELNLSTIQYKGKTAVMSIARDITEQKQREQKILSMNEATQQLINSETQEELTEKAFEAVRELFEVKDIGFQSSVLGFLGDKKPGYEEAVQEARERKEPVYIFAEELEEIESGFVFALPVGDYGISVGKSDSSEITEVTKRLAELFSSNVEAAIDNLAYQNELKRERDRFVSLFENSPDPVVKTRFEDSDPIVERVNDAFEKVFGYEQDDIEEESLNDVIVPDHRKPLAKKVDKDYQEMEVITEEVRREAADGIRDFKLTVFPANREFDKNESYGIYTDITETKKRQREIERQNEQLEKFSGILSHELRNPLNIAKGYLNMLDGGEEKEEIGEALTRMEHIIDDVLDMAKHGQSVEDTEKIDIGEAAEETWNMIETEDSELEIKNRFEVSADRNRLEQILSNLFRNSIQHNTEPVKITLGKMRNGFYMEDDGEGISEDKKQEIFEYGSSFDEGTGFGLSIVKSIVEAHGWGISVEESDEGGARFEMVTE
jgi:PAS domain S-box-containing protein